MSSLSAATPIHTYSSIKNDSVQAPKKFDEQYPQRPNDADFPPERPIDKIEAPDMAATVFRAEQTPTSPDVTYRILAGLRELWRAKPL